MQLIKKASTSQDTTAETTTASAGQTETAPELLAFQPLQEKHQQTAVPFAGQTAKTAATEVAATEAAATEAAATAAATAAEAAATAHRTAVVKVPETFEAAEARAEAVVVCELLDRDDR